MDTSVRGKISHQQRELHQPVVGFWRGTVNERLWSRNVTEKQNLQVMLINNAIKYLADEIDGEVLQKMRLQ